MRIIDADALLEQWESVPNAIKENSPNELVAETILNITGYMLAGVIKSIKEAPTIDSIYGYKIEDLILAAETLSKEWVTPRDLANYHDNLKLAFKIVREEQEKAIEKYVEGIGADI